MSNKITYSNKKNNYFHFLAAGYGATMSIENEDVYHVKREDGAEARWIYPGERLSISTFDIENDAEFVKGVEELFNIKIPAINNILWTVAGSDFTFNYIVFNKGDYILFKRAPGSIIGKASPHKQRDGKMEVTYVKENGLAVEWEDYTKSNILSEIKKHYDDYAWMMRKNGESYKYLSQLNSYAAIRKGGHSTPPYIGKRESSDKKLDYNERHLDEFFEENLEE
jgi:hypothetical protein